MPGETALLSGTMKPTLKTALLRGFWAVAGIAAMEALAVWSGEPLSRVPFVTSIVLVSAMPSAAPARPRAIVGGHLISASAGLFTAAVLHAPGAAAAIAVGLAVVAMLSSDTLHPPAGINAFLIPMVGLDGTWILSVVLPGAAVLAAFSMLVSRTERSAKSKEATATPAET